MRYWDDLDGPTHFREKAGDVSEGECTMSYIIYPQEESEVVLMDQYGRVVKSMKEYSKTPKKDYGVTVTPSFSEGYEPYVTVDSVMDHWSDASRAGIDCTMCGLL